jgi:hypothetical protein
MTLHDPAVLSGLFAVIGVAGFLASVANYTHAVCPTSPERPDSKIRHFWAAFYFGGVWLMGVAYFLGWAPAPAPAVVWLSLLRRRLGVHPRGEAGPAVRQALRLRREPELPLFKRRWACFWLVIGVTAGAPLVAGCRGGQTNPAYSPEQKAVVLAERALKANFDTIDAFLLFDDENRAWMRLTLPEVHAFAELLRKPGPDGVQAVVAAQRAAWKAHDAWAEEPDGGQRWRRSTWRRSRCGRGRSRRGYLETR